MKKVVYSVTKYTKGEPQKITGLGFVTNEDLIVACMSRNDKPYIRIFQDCVKDCHPIPDKTGEYKGTFYEIHEIEVETKNGSKDTREIEVEYKIWYKYAG